MRVFVFRSYFIKYLFTVQRAAASCVTTNNEAAVRWRVCRLRHQTYEYTFPFVLSTKENNKIMRSKIFVALALCWIFHFCFIFIGSFKRRRRQKKTSNQYRNFFFSVFRLGNVDDDIDIQGTSYFFFAFRFHFAFSQVKSILFGHIIRTTDDNTYWMDYYYGLRANVLVSGFSLWHICFANV